MGSLVFRQRLAGEVWRGGNFQEFEIIGTERVLKKSANSRKWREIGVFLIIFDWLILILVRDDDDVATIGDAAFGELQGS